MHGVKLNRHFGCAFSGAKPKKDKLTENSNTSADTSALEPSQIENDIGSYSQWRNELSETVGAMKVFLKDKEVTDLRTHHQFDLVLAALSDDTLSVAFVAEFSRGKSEMINTLFFGDYSKRILPSGTGRTTMCPTELMYDPSRAPSVRLLPIESRTSDKPLHELKQDDSSWTEIDFDTDDEDSLATAFSGLTESKLVSREYAESLSFDIMEQDDSEYGLPLNAFDEVEIPSWRHAIINLPHPMLEQGLVILDTPGLNAIGAEPELTIDQLASAHAIIFILSHDTGVTQTDLALWEQHLGGKSNSNNKPQDELGRAGENIRKSQRRLVALNKIDGMWDGIRKAEEIDKELDRQVWQTAKTLGIDPKNIFPVSAQKGLVGRLQNDPEMVKRSRITELESAIANRLIPQKRSIVADKVRGSLEDILDTAGTILNNREQDTSGHIKELKQISNKNTDVISHIMSKVTQEKASLEEDIRRYQALRAVYTKEAGRLSKVLRVERLEKLIAMTRHNMSRCASSITLQKTINKYFEKLHRYLDQASMQATELASLSETITRDFEQDHGIANFQVQRLQLDKFKLEVERLEEKYSHLKDTKTLFFREQMSITNRFYDSVCNASRKIFTRALRDTNNWSNNLMVPMETYVREHHMQLRRRLESVKRIHQATDTVELRLAELEQTKIVQQRQQEQFATLQHRLARLLAVESPAEANKKGDADNSDLRWHHSINF